MGSTGHREAEFQRPFVRLDERAFGIPQSRLNPHFSICSSLFCSVLLARFDAAKQKGFLAVSRFSKARFHPDPIPHLYRSAV
jgi:hypothetical protein